MSLWSKWAIPSRYLNVGCFDHFYWYRNNSPVRRREKLAHYVVDLWIIRHGHVETEKYECYVFEPLEFKTEQIRNQLL